MGREIGVLGREIWVCRKRNRSLGKRNWSLGKRNRSLGKRNRSFRKMNMPYGLGGREIEVFGIEIGPGFGKRYQICWRIIGVYWKRNLEFLG